MIFYYLLVGTAYLALHEVMVHAFPYRDKMVLSPRDQLRNYICGISPVMGLSWIALPTSPYSEWVTVMLGFVFAGLGTSLGYGIDWLIRIAKEHRVLEREREEWENAARPEPTRRA